MTEAKATPIRQLALTPDDEIVALLEGLLAQARRGELLSIAYCGQLTERRVFHGEAGDHEDLAVTCFALDRLKARLMRRYEELIEDNDD